MMGLQQTGALCFLLFFLLFIIITFKVVQVNVLMNRVIPISSSAIGANKNDLKRFGENPLIFT